MKHPLAAGIHLPWYWCLPPQLSVKVLWLCFIFQCYEVPGMKILTYNGPIYYGNRSFLREEMSRLLGLTPEKIRSREKARKALEKRERETNVNTVVRLLHTPIHHSQKSNVSPKIPSGHWKTLVLHSFDIHESTMTVEKWPDRKRSRTLQGVNHFSHSCGHTHHGHTAAASPKNQTSKQEHLVFSWHSITNEVLSGETGPHICHIPPSNHNAYFDKYDKKIFFKTANSPRTWWNGLICNRFDMSGLCHSSGKRHCKCVFFFRKWVLQTW